jgi:hypothetical protein
MDTLDQLQLGELEELDGLLKLGGHDQLLCQFQTQAGV